MINLQILLQSSTINIKNENLFEEFSEYLSKEIKKKINKDCEINIRKLLKDVKENKIIIENYLHDSKYIIMIITEESKEVSDFTKWMFWFLRENSSLQCQFLFICFGDVKIESSSKEYPLIKISLNYTAKTNDEEWKILFSSISGPEASVKNTSSTTVSNNVSGHKASGEDHSSTTVSSNMSELISKIIVLETRLSLTNTEEVISDFLVFVKDKVDSEFKINCEVKTLPLLKDVYQNKIEKYFQDSKYIIMIITEESQEVNDFIKWLVKFLRERTVWQSRLLFICLGDVKIESSSKKYPLIKVSLDYTERTNDEEWKILFSRVSSPEASVKNTSSTTVSNNVSGTPSGLSNRKAICYMNAMMQALASSDIFIKKISNLQETTKDNNLKLLGDVLTEINKINYHHYSDNKASSILLSLMENLQWYRTSQEDAFLLLSYVINHIEKDNNLMEARLMPPKFQILYTFTENKSFNKMQLNLALALPLYGDILKMEISSMMDEFFKPSIIDEGSYSTQLYLFEEAPEVMIIHIQANKWDYDLGAYVKPKYYIKYEEELKYTFTIQKKVDGSEEVPMKVTYQLRAVVHHMGSISGGHYITYRRHGEHWYETNDSYVKQISFKYNIVPYIMVYEKK